MVSLTPFAQLAIGSPMFSMAPLTPSASMKPMDRQCFHWHQWRQWNQWIAICSNGSQMFLMVPFTPMTALMPLAFIGDCGRHIATKWRHYKSHLNCTIDHLWWSSLAPMAMGCTIGAIRSFAIGTNESPLAPFLALSVQMAPMERIPNLMTLLPIFFIMTSHK